MKTTAKAAAVAVVIGAMITVLLGCGSAEQTSGPQPGAPESSTDTQTAQDPAAGAEVRELEVDNGVVVVGMYATRGQNYNDPVGLYVEPGTTVRFENRSGMHSATAYHPDNGRDARIPDGAESWDSGFMSRRGQSLEVTLTVEGVYDYFCIPHEPMGHVGRIIVGDPDASPVPPADGLPAAAREALPSVETIMAEQVVWK